MNKNDIIQYLANADVNTLREIQKHATFYINLLKQDSLASFRVGQHIRFNSSTKPIYMRGATGTIRKINRTKVVVDLDKPSGRFHLGIHVPVALVETL